MTHSPKPGAARLFVGVGALAAALALLPAGAVLADPGGGHGGFGGNSASHISAQGRANSNGPNSADRDFGRARAEDRQNSHASTHGSTRGGGHHHSSHGRSHASSGRHSSTRDGRD